MVLAAIEQFKTAKEIIRHTERASIRIYPNLARYYTKIPLKSKKSLPQLEKIS